MIELNGLKLYCECDGRDQQISDSGVESSQ